MRRKCTNGVCLVAWAVAVSLAACDDSTAIKESSRDAGLPAPTVAVDGGDQDGGAKDCFDNPKTHFEIINACTSATRIAKNPTLTKLQPDGGLPPLN